MTKHQRDEIASPAKITDQHVQDRHLDKAGNRMGWSKLTHYERAHRGGKLMDKERCKTTSDAQAEAIRALDRYEAAKALDEGWKICNASWPSGFDPNRIRCAGIPGSFADAQRDTKAFWRRVELSMGTRDWMICRRVCGEDYAIAETVVAISPGYKFSTLARFREALDSLVEAVETARRK